MPNHFAISLYNPNKGNDKEPFGVSVESSVLSDAEVFLNPNVKTFITEDGQSFTERVISLRNVFRKEVVIYLNKDDERFAHATAVFYNLPLLMAKGYNMGVMLNKEDTAADKIESMFLFSLMNDESRPDISLVSTNRPVLLLKEIVVDVEERGKGYGSYLFSSFEDYVRSVFGFDFGSVFVSNVTLLSKGDHVQTQEAFLQYYTNKQSIVLKWFDDAGYESYYADGSTPLKFFVKRT